MLVYGLPILFAITVWWLSTGVILWVAARPQPFHKTVMAIATLLALAAFALLAHTSTTTGMASVYGGFIAAIVIWGWHELSFLYGYVTGPRTTACPIDARGARRFSNALETILFHEIAILITGIAIAFICIGAENITALATYLILWAMRISAKLNLFFGAPNITLGIMPQRLAYLESYFKKGPVSLFFPLSVTAGTLATIWLAMLAASAETTIAASQFTLLSTLLGLAVIEHWFFVIPFNEIRMWSGFLSAKSGAPSFAQSSAQSSAQSGKNSSGAIRLAAKAAPAPTVEVS